MATKCSLSHVTWWTVPDSLCITQKHNNSELYEGMYWSFNIFSSFQVNQLHYNKTLQNRGLHIFYQPTCSVQWTWNCRIAWPLFFIETKFTLVLVTYGTSDLWDMVDTQILDTNKIEEDYICFRCNTGLHPKQQYNHSCVSDSINL